MSTIQNNRTVQSFWLALGGFCSFAFGIISSMILSRYFDKSDYGTYKQVLYVYNTLLTVFTLGLPSSFAYFLPRVPQNEARDLIKKITGLFFLLGAFFSVLLFVFAGPISVILKNPELEFAIRLFSIVPFLMMPTMGLEGILATFNKTKFMAAYNVVTRIIMLCCVALPVLIFGVGYRGAIIGFVVGSVLSFIIALGLKYYPVRDFGTERCKVSFKDIFKFSIPLLVASLWGIIISSADQFFISRYYGEEVFAEFSNGALELPFIVMVSSACATVLAPVFSRMSHEKVDLKNEMLPLWMNVFKKTIKLLYPIVIFCIVFADAIMVVLYGKEYEVSGTYFRIKLLTNFFTLIAFAPLIINTGNVKFYSNVHMIAAIALVIVEYLSVLIINNPIAISWVSAICKIGTVFVLLSFIARMFSVKLHQLFPLDLLAKIIIPSVIVLIIERYVLIDILHISYLLSLIIGLMVYAILLYAYSIPMKFDYIGIIRPLLKK